MKIFLKHKIQRKIQIMLVIFLLVNIVLLSYIINDFIKYSIPYYYILFILLWFWMSLFFRKDKTIKWDSKLEKVIKNTEISTFVIIISIILIRKFILPDVLEYYGLVHITTITLIVTFWFFSWKLYFMWDKLKDIFLDINIK